jgi:hypothetical protein
MDWMFYLVIFAIVFGFLAVMQAIRYVLSRRLEKEEKKRRMAEDARQISESNSGL